MASHVRHYNSQRHHHIVKSFIDRKAENNVGKKANDWEFPTKSWCHYEIYYEKCHIVERLSDGCQSICCGCLLFHEWCFGTNGVETSLVQKHQRRCMKGIRDKTGGGEKIGITYKRVSLNWYSGDLCLTNSPDPGIHMSVHMMSEWGWIWSHYVGLLKGIIQILPSINFWPTR